MGNEEEYNDENDEDEDDESINFDFPISDYDSASDVINKRLEQIRREEIIEERVVQRIYIKNCFITVYNK